MAHARLHDHSNVLDGSPIAVAGVPNLPASKITSEQFPLGRMPRGIDGRVLTGTGVGSDPAYEEVSVEPNVPAWELIATLTPANVASISTGVVTEHDVWMIIFNLDFTSGATGIYLGLRFNGDASAIYRYMWWDSLVIKETGGATLIKITGNTSAGRLQSFGVIYVRGHAESPRCIVNVVLNVSGGHDRGIEGYYDLAAPADITQIDFLSNSNFRGTIKVYAMNY